MEKFLSLQGNLQNGIRSVSMGVKTDRNTREGEICA
jgi:hypothetical protein